MSKIASHYPQSRPVHQRRRWGIRSGLLIFFCMLLLWSGIFGSWNVIPAQAATRPSSPNPTLKAPSSMHTPAAVKPPDLRVYVQGHPSTKVVPIPHPRPSVLPPLTTPLTTQAQRILSRDGTFEVAIAAGTINSAEIRAAGGSILLQVTQLAGASGGSQSGRVFLGTYQLSLLNANGAPLGALALAHPFMLRYHASQQQGNWFWQNQTVDAIWQQGGATSSSVHAAATTQPLTTQASHLLLGQKDPKSAVWGVTVDLSSSSQAAHAVSGASSKSVIPASTAPPGGNITFSTAAPTASWGKTQDFDVGLSSGSLDYTYPLSLPPGPGGLTPPLNLAYSSGSVNESHNLQASASWVGEGWSLSLGSVSWGQENVTPGKSGGLSNVWNINDTNGLSGQLIPPDLNTSTASPSPVPSMSALPAQYIWHTAPESHAKIQEVNFGGSPCWHAWLPNGLMEEFGCVEEARQSAKDANGDFTAYRWDLDLIVDRYGNQVRIHYQRNYPAGGNVRDAVVSSIEYDDPSCHNTSFTGATAQCASWHPQITVAFDAATKPASLTNSTGCQNWTSTSFRCDDPVDLSSSGGLSIANAQNTYVLNDVKVQINGHLLREYALSYDQGGPTSITDPLTGQKESVAGYLNLTKVQQLGTDGQPLNAPTTTISYTEQTQHYEDLAYHATPTSNCGPPSWTPRNAGGCYVWSQSYNSYYIQTLDNGMGWHETINWKEARNNTHGVDTGRVSNDPFTCDGNESSSNLCGQADDENWSRMVVSSRISLTNGVTATWAYLYYLTALTAKPCSNCTYGYSWGDQNDGDYADFYNDTFTSFASAEVTNPDNSSQIDTFASTPGWGLAESGFTCSPPAGGTCNTAPYWNLAPGGAGKLESEQEFGTDGKLMQVTNNTYAMNCPPPGVSHSGNTGSTTNNPGNQYLISELDKDNPVVVCDPRVTQVDTYRIDGVTDINGYLTDARVLHKTVNTTYDGDNQGVSAYDYGNVSKVDTTANDVGGAHFVQAMTYYPNDNLGSNVYLTDLPAQAKNQDGSGTTYGCSASIYGSNTSAAQAPTIPGVTQQVGYVQQQAGCTSSTVTTQHTFDSSGNPITATDADGHQGCTLAGSTTQYTSCATYDGSGTHLTNALNAKNQAVTYRYDTTLASTGYGQWLMGSTDANGQTTVYSYDTLGRLTSVIAPGDSQAKPTISYTYIKTCTTGSTAPCLEVDTTTRVTSGSNTTMTSKQWYDGMGNLVETQAPGPNQFSKVPAIGSLVVTYSIYDNMGRVTTKSMPYAIAASSTIRYAQPDLNQARTVTSYDNMGRPQASVSYGLGVVILSTLTTSYTVGQGLPSFNVDTSTPFEQTITQDAYNHQSVSYTDALGRSRYGQVFSGVAAPYTVVRTVQFNQDEVGNLLSTITFDATSKALASSSATYDGLQRVTGKNDSDLGSCANTPLPTSCSNSSDTAWKVSYDAVGNTLSQTDPRNVTTYTSYDVLDRPLCHGTSSAQVNPCQSSAYTTYFYDSYDNSSNPGLTFPSDCSAPSGASTPIGKTIAETFSGDVGSGWRCSGYDARGQTVASALSVTADGQTTTQNVATSYDDRGQVTSVTYPDGEILTSNYDSQGFLRSIYFGTSSSSDPVSFLTGQISYTNTGLLAGLALGGTANKTSVPTPVFSTTLGYDGIQRLVSSSATRAGASSPFWSQTRTLDNVGNVLQLSTTLPTSSGGSLTDNQAFCYDALGRLVWAGNSDTPAGGDHCGLTPTGSTTSGYSQSFSYDALDRMTSGAAGTVTYGDPSHVHAATGLSSVTDQYASYDAMGNMICRNTVHDETQNCAGESPTGATMSYDNEGKLVRWKAPAGLTDSDQFLYDAEGNRVLQRSSTAGMVTDTITFDNFTDVTIADGTSTVTNYYQVAGQRVAMRKGATLSYLMPDFLGSDNIALNYDGSVQAVQLFAPYGSVRYSDLVMPTDYNFTGQRLDSATGLLYDIARYYDPLSGRFTTADTQQNNSSGMDSYAYVGDSPETRTDPTGHRPIAADGSGAGYDSSYYAANSAPTPTPPPPPAPAPAPSTNTSSDSGGGFSWGSMWSGVQNVGSKILDATTGIPSMVHDVQTVFNGNASIGSKLWAVADFGFNAVMDVGMLTGIGEVARGLVFAAHVAGDLIGHAVEHTAEHAVSDVVEHAATDVVEHATTQETAHAATKNVEHAVAGCGGLSFVASTPVALEVGARAIGTLKVGEKVWAYNPSTKKMEVEPILHVWINHDHDLVDLTITYTIKQGKTTKPTSEVLHTNKKHPFLTLEKGFLPVGQIKLGMHVVEADGQLGVISGWKVVPGVKTMYNLEVAQDHTFTVGVGMWVVHNSICSDPVQASNDAVSALQSNDWHHILDKPDHLWSLTGETIDGNKELIRQVVEANHSDINIAGGVADYMKSFGGKFKVVVRGIPSNGIFRISTAFVRRN